MIKFDQWHGQVKYISFNNFWLLLSGTSNHFFLANLTLPFKNLYKFEKYHLLLKISGIELSETKRVNFLRFTGKSWRSSFPSSSFLRWAKVAWVFKKYFRLRLMDLILLLLLVYKLASLKRYYRISNTPKVLNSYISLKPLAYLTNWMGKIIIAELLRPFISFNENLTGKIKEKLSQYLKYQKIFSMSCSACVGWSTWSCRTFRNRSTSRSSASGTWPRRRCRTRTTCCRSDTF